MGLISVKAPPTFIEKQSWRLRILCGIGKVLLFGDVFRAITYGLHLLVYGRESTSWAGSVARRTDPAFAFPNRCVIGRLKSAVDTAKTLTPICHSRVTSRFNPCHIGALSGTVEVP